MIRLWKINGSPLTTVFTDAVLGSEIYVSKLGKSQRLRFVNLVIKKGFDQVILINPELDGALIELIDSLARAFVRKIFVVSNQNVLRPKEKSSGKGNERVPASWFGEKTEWAVSDLSLRLPQTTICRTNDQPLLSLVEEMKNLTGFLNGKELIITNFSVLSIIGALRVLGFPYDYTDRFDCRHGCYSKDYETEPPNPLNELFHLVNSWEEDKRLQEIGVDRRDVFETILQGLIAN
ncbi:MAG: hypothetical protein WC523_02835 [Patescibacteria group bacterium]